MREFRVGRMPAEKPASDFRELQLRDWNLCLLRFVITQAPEDQAAALACAIELDMPGGFGRATFFQRTSAELFHAIAARDKNAKRVLRLHISRIDEPRLRNAFVAAIGDEAVLPTAQRKRKSDYSGPTSLWRGLARL